MNILAMDLGKSKTVFCDYDSETGVRENIFHQPSTEVFDICSV